MGTDGAAPTVTGYERLIEISRTDRAVVYRAYQPAFRRDVAIKVYAGGGPTFEENRRLLGALAGHPSVVAVHEFGVLASGAPFVVMELLDSRTPPDGALVARELASLTEYASQKGLAPIVMEPEHIWLSAFGGPKWTGRHVSTPPLSPAPDDGFESPALAPLPVRAGPGSEEPTIQVGLVRRRRHGRTIAVLAIVAGLCLAALGSTFSAESASPPPQSTTSVGPLPATTRTVPTPATTTTALAPGTLGAVLFQDDLSEPGAFTASAGPNSTTSFDDRRMRIAVHGTSFTGRNAFLFRSASHGRMSVSVDLRLETSGAAGGPACVHEDSATYTASVRDDGWWMITAIGLTTVQLASGRTSPPGTSFRVRLDCIADQAPTRLALWIDGRLVGQGTDASQPVFRGAGVVVGASPRLEAGVSFANFEVRAID